MSEAIRTAVKAPEAKKENQVSQAQKGNLYQPLSSPVEQILFLQRTVGNRAVQRLMKSGALQAKLRIGAPGDAYEQEADSVADAVMRMPEPQAVSGGTPSIQRACPACEEEELRREPVTEKDIHGDKATLATFPQTAPDLQKKGCEECKIAPPSQEDLEEEQEDEAETATINRKEQDIPAGGPTNASLSDLEDSLKRLKAGGHPLPQDIRLAMEAKFGEDFSNVHIHTGSEIASISRSIQAMAFTHENHIFFNEGKYNPNTLDGGRLLAHELAHVVQQRGTSSILPKIQRSEEIKFGDWAHDKIQALLRDRDNKLITEAPIPGGKRSEKKPNTVGFADLYKGEGQVISGISAQEPAESKKLLIEHAFYKYVNMRSDWKRKAASKSAVKFGPKITNHKKDIWDFSPNFPSNFHVGEIKPLFPLEFPQSLASHGMGEVQVANYREGFEEFVLQVYKDNPKHQGQLPPKITGRFLNLDESNIPDAINYKKFEQERLTGGKEAILKGDMRLWFYNKYKNKDGVSVYFLIPHPYKSEEFPARIEKQLQQLDPLLHRLRQKHPKMSNNVLTKRDPHAQKLSSYQIPRKPVPNIQAKGTDWSELAKAWESDRKKWTKGQEIGVEKPKKFLKEQAKGVEKKAKVDAELNITPSSAKIKEEIKNVKKIRFWSSFRGRIFGALRFRFGNVFDKVEEFFQKMKEKFKKHHENSGKLNKKEGIFDGWKKVATKAIIKFGVEILKEMLVEAFRGFVNCINGIIEAIVNKFTSAVDEVKEDLTEEIEPVCCEFIDFKKRLEEEYNKHEKTIASFTEAVETIQKWREILDEVETAVRIGVQIVSCGTPPGLGCLWGLVAQIGISTGLSLLARTDYFEEEIAKPAARELMDATVGDSLHNFLVEILEGTPLKSYIAEAGACSKRTRVLGSTVIGGNLGKLDPNDPEIAKIRQEWEKEFESKILEDLQKVFEKEKGKKVTKEDLQELIKFIQQSNKKPDELKAMLENARNPLSGKLSIEKAKANVEQGEVPESKPKERKIDYEKATRNNAKYQMLLGWDPLTFYKKPGIKVDSEEFADAVYDLQEALHIKADGILGEETLIAFYDRNKLKEDIAYRDAIKMRDEKQAAREKAAEKKAAEGKAEGRVPAIVPPAATFTVLNGNEVIIKDQNKYQNYPKGVNVYLHSPDFSDLVTQPTPDDRKLINVPKYVTLDIYVDEKHTYRIQNVSVKSMYLSRTILSIGVSGIWSLYLILEDGIQLATKSGELVLRQQIWSAD